MGSEMIVQELVIRDFSGKVINIGQWDYAICIEDEVEYVSNPLPENATSQIEDVQINEDGSRITVNQ